MFNIFDNICMKAEHVEKRQGKIRQRGTITTLQLLYAFAFVVDH